MLMGLGNQEEAEPKSVMTEHVENAKIIIKEQDCLSLDYQIKDF